MRARVDIEASRRADEPTGCSTEITVHICV